MGKHNQLTSSLSISFTKLISDNKVDWDEHLPTMFFSYIITYKSSYKVYSISIGIWITSFYAHIIYFVGILWGGTTNMQILLNTYW
jgi:hypothetical protein